MKDFLTSYSASVRVCRLGGFGEASSEKRGVLLVKQREGGVALARDLSIGAGGEGDEGGRNGERMTKARASHRSEDVDGHALYLRAGRDRSREDLVDVALTDGARDSVGRRESATCLAEEKTEELTQSRRIHRRCRRARQS